MRRAIKRTVLTIFLLFLFPLAVHGALYSLQSRPTSYKTADWSSMGMLLPASADREARLLIFTGRTGHWRGIFSVHSWVVLKPEGASSWNRYDVVGWGDPVRINYWEPDSRWWGVAPRVLVDIRGSEAAALIPRVEAAIIDYKYNQPGDYRLWPGPNSNTFIASLLRAMPELETTLPSNAIGKDFRPAPYLGLTDSRTGIEASLFGILGIKLGWVEGVELNFLGLITGLDLRHPAVKLPGFGRIGVDDGTALAAPAH
jgi:Protein of unknown function (DUF3750)